MGREWKKGDRESRRCSLGEITKNSLTERETQGIQRVFEARQRFVGSLEVRQTLKGFESG